MLAGADEILRGLDSPRERPKAEFEDPLKGLNERQREAVTAPDGPTLVLAGPGSGKTTVIVARIAHLVANRGVEPERIASITFTRKAADEMRGRVQQKLGPEWGNDVWVSTFHRLCGHLLRRHGEQVGLQPGFRIAQGADQFRLMHEASRHVLGDGNGLNVKDALQDVSRIKNRLESPGDPEQWSRHPNPPVAAQIGRAYQEQLTADNKIDFDDMMLYSIQLLHEQPMIREETEQERPYLLVDEYQDTNLPQYVLIQQLSESEKNVFCVGDPDQAIYEWRGASVQNLLRFEEDFPGGRRIDLETTYRSTGTILEAASAVIRRNETRVERELTTTQEQGSPITIHQASTSPEEARYAVKVAGDALRTGTAAILYRTNAQSRAMEDRCRRAEVPYEIAGGESFYERQEVIDGLCCLQVALDPRASEEATRRFLAMPPGDRLSGSATEQIEFCGSSDESWYDRLKNAVEDQILSPQDEAAAADRITKIEALSKLGDKGPDEILRSAMEITGYTKALRESDDRKRYDKLDNIDELMVDAWEFRRTAEAGQTNGETSQAFATRCAEMQRWARTGHDDGTRKVTLSTLHAAKGREFDTVVLAGADSQRMPHYRSVPDKRKPEEGTEEERRLTYVGMTRARSDLHVTYAKTINAGGKPKRVERSPFLNAIPDRLVRSSQARPPAPAPAPASGHARATVEHARAAAPAEDGQTSRW